MYVKAEKNRFSNFPEVLIIKSIELQINRNSISRTLILRHIICPKKAKFIKCFIAKLKTKSKLPINFCHK